MALNLQGMGADDVTKQMAKRQAGKVQGTDADLRRMTTAQAKERLRCGYGGGRGNERHKPICPVCHKQTMHMYIYRRGAGARLVRPAYAG